ncbi:hypothetical protein ES319_A08G204600v1 [Gossypium barbadense]|uniref:Uncharacterized protein n=3 Tax=Gossypium TaxID=3633 RepID=A0A5J5UUE7_GOSBA|nr:hypothetical protein ES319_A08G204600v1 [Gossypium barbadense]KAB2071171.1 hypothetical protein ES319_A08G204600v1 [Gossypium barbadense]TYH07354.1 hypothetical protein ES288_A08G227100v1 [Gossypium darwinii]
MRIQYAKTKFVSPKIMETLFPEKRRRNKKKKVVILWYLRFSAKRDFAVFTTVREAEIINDNSTKQIPFTGMIDTGGWITDNVDIVVTANQPTQIDHARCDNEVNPECSVQTAYCEETKGGGNDFVKCCYNKRRRISVNRR